LVDRNDSKDSLAAFSKLFKISLRNLLRNKRRTIITLSIVILGGAGLMQLGGFFQSINNRLLAGLIYGGMGNVQLGAPGYYEKGGAKPFSYLLTNFEEIRKMVNEDPRVFTSIPRLSFGGMLSNGTADLSVVALGVDSVSENKMMGSKNPKTGETAGSLVAGKELSADDPYGILVGEELKDALGLRIGDSVSFLTTQKEGAIDGGDFYVRGVYRGMIQELSGRIIKIPLSTAQTLLGLDDQVHTIRVILHEESFFESDLFVNELKTKLSKKGFELEFIPWQRMAGTFFQTKNFLDGIYQVVQIIVGLVFILSISNTINMTLFERMREYGTMMAIGNGRRVIFFEIVSEAVLLGFLGAILAVAFGLLISKIVSVVGIMMPPPPLLSSGVSALRIYIDVYPSLILEVFAICAFSTIISSFFPAYRITQYPIVRALGYV